MKFKKRKGRYMRGQVKRKGKEKIMLVYYNLKNKRFKKKEFNMHTYLQIAFISYLFYAIHYFYAIC